MNMYNPLCLNAVGSLQRAEKTGDSFHMLLVVFERREGGMHGQASFAMLRACFYDTFLDEDRLRQEEHSGGDRSNAEDVEVVGALFVGHRLR